MRVNFFSFLSSSAWVGSLSFAFGLVVAPLGASLINRFACRAVSMAGCLACASGLAVASFASSLTLLFVSYAVFGCGSGCVLVLSVVVVRRCFDKRQSLAFGVSAAGQKLQGHFDPSILAPNRTFLFTLQISEKCRVSTFFSPLPGEKKNVVVARLRFRPAPCFIFNRPDILLCCHHMTLLNENNNSMVFGVTFFSIQVKFAQDRGTSFSAASRLVLYLGITAVVGRFAGGFLCSIKRLKNLYILQGAGLINGISMMLLTLAQSYPPLVAYAFTFGFCDGVTATVMNIEAVTCVDHYRAASSFGHFLLTISVTTLVGPPISGKAYRTLATTFFSDARQPEVMLLSF